jgi:hypothetical protein
MEEVAIIQKNISNMFSNCPCFSCTDLLSNTAQALTSYVEALQESDKGSPVDPLPLLEESLELFQQCLTLQELQYQEYQELQQRVAASSTPDNQDYDPEEGGVSLASTSSMDIDSELSTPSTDRTIPMDIPSSPPQLDDDRWATIVEPVTNSSLLDTLIAQLQALATLCTLLPVPSGEALDYIASYAKGIIDIKLDAYVIGTGRDIEALIARDDYFCAWADTQYHNGLCTVQSYYNIVTNAYAFEGFDTHAEALCKRAEALVGFHHTLRASPDAYQYDSLTASWEALSAALGCLAKASKLPDVENLAAIHITRGDAELLRFQMGKEQVPYEPAEKYAAALVKNAEVFYRGGKNEARARGMEALEVEGTVKEALARGLKGENEYIVELVKTRAEATKVIGDAVDDGFVRKEQLEQMGLNF